MYLVKQSQTGQRNAMYRIVSRAGGGNFSYNVNQHDILMHPAD